MSEHIDAPAPSLPPCKRYITTHSPAGKSIYIDSPAQVYHPVPGVGAAARSYAIGSVPAHLADDADLAAYRAEDGVTSHRRRDTVLPQPGANLVVVDLEPGAVSEMHRTVSVDFSVCVVGEIDHELDGGETVRLFPGDHIVQRGTMHRWINPTEKPARFVACTIPCVPFDVAGERLREMSAR